MDLQQNNQTYKRLPEEVVVILKRPTPTKYTKKLFGSAKLTSIKSTYIIETLNDAFGIGGWDIIDIETLVDSEQDLIIRGRLYFPEYNIKTALQIGADQKYIVNKKTGEVTTKDLGNVYKGAYTNLLSKLSAFCGIALDVFLEKKYDNKNFPKEAPKLTEYDILNQLKKINSESELRKFWEEIKGDYENNQKIYEAVAKKANSLQPVTAETESKSSSEQPSIESILEQIEACKKVKDLEKIWHNTPKALQANANVIAVFADKKKVFLDLAVDAIDKSDKVQDLQKLYDTYKESFKRMTAFHEAYAARKKELLTPSKKQKAA